MTTRLAEELTRRDLDQATPQTNAGALPRADEPVLETFRMSIYGTTVIVTVHTDGRRVITYAKRG